MPKQYLWNTNTKTISIEYKYQNNICGIQIHKQYLWNTNTKTIFVEYKYKNSICGMQTQKQYVWNTNKDKKLGANLGACPTGRSLKQYCKHTFGQTNFFIVKLQIFSYPSFLSYVLGVQKNRINEAVLLCTRNMCFG